MVEKMHSSGSNASAGDKPPLTCDFELPVFREEPQEHPPSRMTWEEAMDWIDFVHRSAPRAIPSAEERLREKNPEPFRLP